MKKDIDISETIRLRTKYEAKFGECPVGLAEIGHVELARLIEQALKDNKPIVVDLPEDALT